MAQFQSPSLRTRLFTAADAWCAATGRSPGALSSLVTNHGGTLERLRDPNAAVTDVTLEKFARFLMDQGNWPEGAEIAQAVIVFGHAVGVSAVLASASTGQAGEKSGEIGAAA